MLIESRSIVSSLFISTVILFLAWLAALIGKSEVFEKHVEWWRQQKLLKRAAVVAVLIGVIAYAGTKPDPSGGDDTGGSSTNDVTQVEGDAGSTNDVGWIEGDLDGTNDVDQVGGDTNSAGGVILNAPRPMFSGSPSSVGRGAMIGTPTVGAEGFSLVSVGHDEAFDFTPPETAVVATNWLLHGSSTQPVRLSFDDWVFPFGEEGYSNFTVFAYGEVMPGEVNTNRFLVPFESSLGIAPVANWNMMPANETSRFWSGFSPSNTLLLTWQNALLDRAATNPVSFQAELKPSGGFVFRYDLSRLVSDDLLSNAIIKAQSEDASFADAPTTNLTSLAFQTHNEQLCDENREDFDEKMGDEDPYAYPEGSTNTVLEHVFYSGSTNGPFAYPQSTDGNAVLMVSVTGSGSGELIIGSKFVPLVGRPAPVSAPRLFAAPPPSPSTLAVTVPRGSTQKVYMRGDSTLSVSFSSDDFAFGELPDLSGRHFVGSINFPFVNATVPCIHDYNAKKKLVSLPLGDGAGELTCEWQGTSQIEVENIPPVSAMLTGHFSGRTTTPVTYTLSHPNYLFGQTTYSQTARYCPQPPEEDDDDPDHPHSGDYYDDDNDDDDEEHYCWCCFWGSCYPGCGCGCACDIGEGDDEPDEPVDPEPEDYDEASTNYPHMSGVLKIRDPLEYTAPIHLTVPLEHRNCCPCPDHATNWVSVVYKSNRLKVVDAATETDFHSSGESLDVKIAGVSPSFNVGDAAVSFAANGDVCLECEYTVLGVGINGGYIPNVGDADLNMLNEYNSQFGLPIPINTNLWDAVELRLQTNVRLPSGNIHLGFEDSTAPFEAWIYDSWAGEFQKLTSSSGNPLDISFAGWRQLVSGSSDSYSPTTWIYITAAGAGKATLVYKYWGVLDGKIVEDEARQVITAIAPTIRGDVNHDGEINDADAALQVAGVPFRFWHNDETVKGEYVGQDDNIAPNSADDKVNGKYDLINLFPLEIDVSEFAREWGSAAQFKLYAGYRGLKFCVLNGLSSDNITAMQTTEVYTDQNEALEEATLHTLDYGGTNLTSVLRSGGIGKMLAFEASGEIDEWSGPRLVVSFGDRDVYSYRIPLSISSVDNMYRWVNLRGAEIDSTTEVQFPASCSGLPDECLSRDYVFFLHGFNVTAEQARDWNRAMFKRFWWSGSRARYCGVTWNGDDGWINGFSYHLNAFNALKTSDALKNLVNAAPSTQSKVVIAHSLGNMVACEAIRKGMNVDKYFMLNAAVASECFDDSLQGTADNVALYVPQSWRNYPSGSWCSNWSDLFGTSDDRSNLKWKGVFADVVGLTDVYNYYSTGDEVLEADDSVTSLFSGAINWKWSTHFTWSFPFLVIDKPYDLTLERYAWQKQEILKGVDPLVATIGAGWRFDSDPHIDPDDGEFWESICTPAEAQQRLTDGSIVTNSVFGHDVSTFYQSTNNAEDRYRTVAYNVPAISKPTGSTTVSRGFIGNYDLDASEDSVVEDMRPNGWGRAVAPYTTRWLHSDVKDMSFYFSYKVFNAILEEGGLK